MFLVEFYPKENDSNYFFPKYFQKKSKNKYIKGWKDPLWLRKIFEGEAEAVTAWDEEEAEAGKVKETHPEEHRK